jgi:hypothetical protein
MEQTRKKRRFGWYCRLWGQYFCSVALYSAAVSVAPHLVFAIEPLNSRPVEELELMPESELQQELVSTCRAYVQSKAMQNAPAMIEASNYSQRITLVARVKNRNILPAWITPLKMAMYEGTLAGCTVPSP